MKLTTQKLLLWLYEPDQNSGRLVGAQILRLLVPDLSSSGFRSLLNLLQKKSLIFEQVVEGQLAYGLSSYGRTLLEGYFPVLHSSRAQWSGQWQLVTFIEAPNGDRQFRYLRQFLLDHHCGQLSRGNYLYPGPLPESVLGTLNKLYVGKVVATGVGSWDFGDEKLTISKIFHLNDLMSGYSGISKEISRLLGNISNQKSIEDRDKLAICMVFDRLTDLLRGDLGLLLYYYPDLKSGLEHLLQLQSLPSDSI